MNSLNRQLLRFDSVRVAYGERLVLENVTFDAEPGSITAVLGVNGSGKSSLLRAALGLVPFAGDVSVGGRSVRSMTPSERASRIAYVPQRSQLETPMTVRAVVQQGLFHHRRKDRAVTLVDRAIQVSGIHELLDAPFTALSGGQRQRVLLARAIATGSSTLLLDEPTSAQDVQHGLRMVEALRRLAEEGATVLMVSHDLRQVRESAHHAVVLHRGAVLTRGTGAEVTLADPILRAFGVDVLENRALGLRLPVNSSEAHARA
ncbi:MAG: ABC transporter ATP-binding protein [Planctomycetota bacterium]